MERVITLECGYDDEYVSVIYKTPEGNKRIRREEFKPFVWVQGAAISKMCGGRTGELKKLMGSYGIGAKSLKTKVHPDDKPIERIENGYTMMFYAKARMPYQKFLNFFKKTGVPVYGKKDKDGNFEKSERYILSVSPIEQHMMRTGKRLFKGYDNYDDLKRLVFDLETQGLNARVHRIEQIGIRTNKGYKNVIPVSSFEEELPAIRQFLKIVREERPDVVIGNNSENFDWGFIETRCEMHGTTLQEVSGEFFPNPIYKRKNETVLKLGGEVEYYRPTVIWGHNVVDSLHAVRRAQAIDSNMESASLKYVTRYLDLKKPNRVYVPGNQISTIWNVTDPLYAFNDEDGDWYRTSEEKPLRDNYEAVSGQYVVKRYLLDDLWETDKIEVKLNEANFLVAKMLPTTFQRACTMGTAGIWKLIMLAWCCENDLAVPAFSKRRRFTGGLSRLLKTGYVDRIVKLDYNSLYPSIILTWHIVTTLDIMGVMPAMLEYVLTGREKYKGLKKKAGKTAKQLRALLETLVNKEDIRKMELEVQKWSSEEIGNDKKQLPLKTLGNSYFGSFGAPNLFPYGDSMAAEKTTCIGRMCLRLMISHFTSIGYEPIVGDTDGFNFQMPPEDQFRYTDQHPYISNGLGRNSEKDKAYVGVDADVAEFEDTFFSHPWNGGVNKMGLGVDEYCQSTINFSRKNYADLLENGKTKKVGNTIKSRKMSGYLKTFLDTGIDLLLHGKGQEFLDLYYKYIDDIYNYRIPVKDIASKGKIKKTLDEYIKDCGTLTKSGGKKSRQAWYELAIREKLNVNISDTIYYINVGKAKSHGDVKRVKTEYMYDEDGNLIECKGKPKTAKIKAVCEEKNLDYKSLTAKQKTELIKPFIVKETEEIILNCRLVPQDIIESDEDVMCSEVKVKNDKGEEEALEYNVTKYIDQFNKRVVTLLVCFSPEIRGEILIDNPDDRKSFTQKQAQLVSGFPNKESDQDTYEALMTPERKEIEFWLKAGEEPPFVKECGIDWDGLVQKHLEVLKKEEDALFKQEDKRYLEALEQITEEDLEKLENEGILPEVLNDIVVLDNTLHFKFVKLPDMSPSTGGYLFEDVCHMDISEEEYERLMSEEFAIDS